MKLQDQLHSNLDDDIQLMIYVFMYEQLTIMNTIEMCVTK